LAKGVAKLYGKGAMKGKKSKKGYSQKLNANNLCQRKLF
jgi:hypothetical protein